MVLTKPKKKASSEKILAVAEALFAEKGFAAASMNDIARRARVSKANVFHHFGSKRDLYIAVLRKACDTSSSVLRSALDDEPHKNPLDLLRELHRDYLKTMFEHPLSTMVILREVIEKDSPDARMLVAQVFGADFVRFVSLIGRAQKQGYIRKELNPALLAANLLAMNMFFFQGQGILQYMPQVDFARNMESYCDQCFDSLLYGVAATQEQPES